MSQIVHCDVCGGVYNQSYISAHKRLSHGIGGKSKPSDASERQSLEAVLALYEQLSEESKKQVRNQLGTADMHVK